jgi:uncharacterized Zn-binding protein involved in type VI secretion
MGKPAARLGDMTAHGGSIVVGLPTVLIGGMPAARVGDMHVCPMLNPGVPPPPHVGGPIMMGSPMVLIGGMPAARMGDMVTCAGPPDTIMLGCMTVLIGEGGSGSAAGGGAGTSAAANAQASAATAKWNNLESTTKREHWVEFQFVDKAGLPVSGVGYVLKTPDGRECEGVLRLNGRVRRDSLPSGQSTVDLRDVMQAAWSATAAQVGEKVKLAAKTRGFYAGAAATFTIFQRDVHGVDVPLAVLEKQVAGDKAEAFWECPSSSDTEPDSLVSEGRAKRFFFPTYYFVVQVGNRTARSGLLSLTDTLEIQLVDDDDRPISGEECVVYFRNGQVRKAVTDSQGQVKTKSTPPGHVEVILPTLSEETGS